MINNSFSYRNCTIRAYSMIVTAEPVNEDSFPLKQNV